ncbi:MAG: calcium/sodium antiporter [Ruminococcaceae bacterium]|nr:calcium/sodium antiporter [Oscillospiraceae bacterium]
MNIFLLILGFVLLIKGADFFVDGSSSVAKLLKVPSVVIGLTIVAMGTSAPEAAVSITAGVSGSNEIAISNVVGSNIFNMLMVVGVCALIKPFDLDKTILKRDFPINIVCSAIVLGMIIFGSALSRFDGIALLVLMGGYLTFLVVSALKNREDSTDDIKSLSPLLSIIYIVLGLVAIIYGGDLVVDNATVIAKAMGWSETFIGLTIIAIGTSLPELVTSIVASRKGENSLALGNVVGSNIFNLMFILGLSSSISSIPVDSRAIANGALLLVMTVLVYIMCVTRKKVGRVSGALMVSLYAIYTAYLLYVG